MPGVTLWRGEGVVKVWHTHIKNLIQMLGSVDCKKSITDSASACSDKSITHFQRYSNPSPSAVQHESRVCYNSATQSPQFDVHFLKSSWRSLLLEARFLTWNSEICRLMNSKEVMGCDIIIGGLPNVTVWQRRGGQFCCKIAWRNYWMAPYWLTAYVNMRLRMRTGTRGV